MKNHSEPQSTSDIDDFLEDLEVIFDNWPSSTEFDMERVVADEPAPYLTATMFLMAEVAEVPTEDYELFQRMERYYPFAPPAGISDQERDRLSADLGRRSGEILCMIECVFTRQFGRHPLTRDLLDILISLLRSCEKCLTARGVKL